jgi:hypothetical protein
VMRGRMPLPNVAGPQHRTFEDTLPSAPSPRRDALRDDKMTTR